jgi:chromate transporter
MTDRTTAAAAGPTHGISLGDAFWVWLRVALLSFGGPAGQIVVMHRILVEEKNWISEGRFLHALNYCMPGPEAQQLATYIGWLMHRTLGGIVAGCLFILPGVVSIMALSYVYATYGNVGFVEALLYGLKAAVLAIVIQAVVRVGKRALRNNVMRALAAAAFVAIFFFAVPFPVIILAAGLIGYLGARAGRPEFEAGGRHGGPKSTATIDSMMGDELPDHVRPSVRRALRVSAIWLLLWLVPVVALPAVYSEANVVSHRRFLQQDGDGDVRGRLRRAGLRRATGRRTLSLGAASRDAGRGMAETTPGPLVMVLQFVGFMAAFRDPGSLSPMVAGTLGGLLATWVTSTPCFLWIFLGAPFIEVMKGNKALAGALSAITAAVVGVVLNLSFWFAIHTIFREVLPIRNFGLSFEMPVMTSVEPAALILSLAAATAIFRFSFGMLTVLGGACAAELLLRVAGAI